jgi:DNA-binding NtrC family response regulator
MSAPARIIREGDHALPLLIGEHSSIVAIRDSVARAACMDLPVVIQGETGTGKEIVAQLLHHQSGRVGQLVALNVAAVPEALAEAELFGVSRGAFTGATHDRAGLLEDANMGTLFLDESSDLARTMQMRLLRVLETGETRRLGGREHRRTTFRLVMGVQHSVAELLAQGRWRPDFMFRVAGLTLQLPRLVDRGRDIAILTNHYLGLLSLPALAAGSEKTLLAHHWPGNVRELKLAVARAAFLNSDPDGSDIVEAARVLLPPNEGSNRTVMQSLRDANRDHVLSVLASCGGDALAAARILLVSKATVYRQIREARGHSGGLSGAPEVSRP